MSFTGYHSKKLNPEEPGIGFILSALLRDRAFLSPLVFVAYISDRIENAIGWGGKSCYCLMSKTDDEKLNTPIASLEKAFHTLLGDKDRCKSGKPGQCLRTGGACLNDHDPEENEFRVLSKHSEHAPEQELYEVWQVADQNNVNPYTLRWIDSRFSSMLIL